MSSPVHYHHHGPTLRDHFAAMRDAQAQHQLRLCLAAAAFVEFDGPRCMALSQNDYARGTLGVRPSQFKRWVRIGRLLRQSRTLREAFAQGRLSFGAWDELALSPWPADWIERRITSLEAIPVRQLRRLLRSTSRYEGTEDVPAEGECAAGANESVEHADPTEHPHDRLSLSLPVAIADYVDDTLRIARALLGADLPDDACFESIVAEASSEIDPLTDVDSARERQASHWRRVDAPASGRREAPSPSAVLAVPRSLSSNGSPSRRVRPREDGRWRRGCHILHRLLVRRLADLRDHEARRDDRLLQLKLDGAHTRWGFRRFQDFAEEALDLPPSSTWDRIRRARRARTNEPLTLARITGRIGAVQADLLERLHRRERVPLSDIERWIDFAAVRTTQALREACAWAASRSATDHVRWSLEGHPPPTEDQLRTSNRPLEQIVHTRAELEEWQTRAPTMPWVERTWILESDVLGLLLQQMDHLDSRRPWLALARVCAIARKSWSEHLDLRSIPSLRRKVLQRDAWSCQVPECSSRRGLQVHHIHYASRGGPDAEHNLVVLCAFHHLLGEHGGLLRVRGRVRPEGGGLRWEMGFDEKGRPLRVYRDDRLIRPRSAAAASGRTEDQRTDDQRHHRGESLLRVGM